MNSLRHCTIIVCCCDRLEGQHSFRLYKFQTVQVKIINIGRSVSYRTIIKKSEISNNQSKKIIEYVCINT